MMKLFRVGIAAFASAFLMFPAQAQPAKGAPAAFERVREVTTTRFKDVKLAGDPDKDFATMLIAHHEDLIFLAKTQLEYGGDREMRQLAQKLLDEPAEGNRRSQAVAGPDAPAGLPRATRPAAAGLRSARPKASDRGHAGAVSSGPIRTGASAAAAQDLPMVSGTVEKVDAAAGKVTIDHGPIPNLDMDSMTMVFRAQDPAMLKAVKPRDKIRFTADRVNGQITVMKIQRGR